MFVLTFCIITYYNKRPSSITDFKYIIKNKKVNLSICSSTSLRYLLLYSLNVFLFISASLRCVPCLLIKLSSTPSFVLSVVLLFSFFPPNNAVYVLLKALIFFIRYFIIESFMLLAKLCGLQIS